MVMSHSHSPIDACNKSTGHQILQILTLIISPIGFGIISLIAIHSFRELRKLIKLHHIIKNLYKTSVLSSSAALLIAFIQTIICQVDPYDDWVIFIMDSIFYLVAYVTFLSLLATLIFRLYNTFYASTYKLSNTNIWLFGITYTIDVILFTISIMEFMYITFAHKGDWIAYSNQFGFNGGYFSIGAIILYIIIGCYAIFLFVKKLMTIATARDYTMKQISLNEKQKALIKRSTKYVSILSLAMFTSFLVSISWICGTFLWSESEDINAILDQSMMLLTLIDSIVNVICLYLQFTFSNEYYEKYCQKWIECCWAERLYSNAKATMEWKRRSKEMEKNGFIDVKELQPVRTNSHDLDNTDTE